MKTRYTDADVVRALQAVVDRDGVRGASRLLDVSPTLVSEVRRGNQPPPPKLAHALGFREDGHRWVRE